MFASRYDIILRISFEHIFIKSMVDLFFKDDDYDIITDNYKSDEGSLAERKATIKALRQSGGLWSSNRFPASLNQDMFYQMTDLDKGVYGKPYNVSLFLHVSN